MMNFVEEIIICFCLISLIFFFIGFVKLLRKNKVEKEEFINYLILRKDMESLYEFGFFNKTYSQEERRVPFLDKLIMSKYEKNKDEKYFNYYEYITKSSKKMILYFFSMFILFCICMTLIQN